MLTQCPFPTRSPERSLMTFNAFQKLLAEHPGMQMKFEFPSGKSLEPHFHITEVAKVTKDFVDCGGTRRSISSCVLQSLVADDTDHRLMTDKLAGILEHAAALGIDDQATVEMEVQLDSISVYEVEPGEAGDGVVVFRLNAKQTQCLAPDKCGIPSLTVFGDDCSGPGCC